MNAVKENVNTVKKNNAKIGAGGKILIGLAVASLWVGQNYFEYNATHGPNARAPGVYDLILRIPTFKPIDKKNDNEHKKEKRNFDNVKPASERTYNA